MSKHRRKRLFNARREKPQIKKNRFFLYLSSEICSMFDIWRIFNIFWANRVQIESNLSYQNQLNFKRAKRVCKITDLQVNQHAHWNGCIFSSFISVWRGFEIRILLGLFFDFSDWFQSFIEFHTSNYVQALKFLMAIHHCDKLN